MGIDIEGSVQAFDTIMNSCETEMAVGDAENQPSAVFSEEKLVSAPDRQDITFDEMSSHLGEFRRPDVEDVPEARRGEGIGRSGLDDLDAVFAPGLDVGSHEHPFRAVMGQPDAGDFDLGVDEVGEGAGPVPEFGTET